MENINSKDFIMFALSHFNIAVVEVENNMLFLEKDYIIEIEGKNLFKLKHEGQVIAPFNEVEEMCNFIKMDISLNEKN